MALGQSERSSCLIAFQLLDTKSTDRKLTLLHYIALIVKDKYPDLANFFNELHFVDKAAAGQHPGPCPATGQGPGSQGSDAHVSMCSIAGECAAGRARAVQGYGAHPPGMQPARPRCAQGLPADV